jgi:hypothetical protein
MPSSEVIMMQNEVTNTTECLVVAPSFDHGLEQTVLPGTGLRLVAPTRRDSYQNRLADAEGDVAEMYQVNARWRRGALDDLPDVEEQKSLRKWFLESGRVFDLSGETEGPMVSLDTLPASLGEALTVLARVGLQSGLLFAADVLVIVDEWVHLLPAGEEFLVRTRLFDDVRRRELVESVSVDVRHAFMEAPVFLAVVLAPQRLQVTHGPRGYRNALLETGMLVGHLGTIFAEHGLNITIAVDFVDTTVDRVLDQDGVERFVVALASITGSNSNGDQ